MNQSAATDVALGDRYRLIALLGSGGMADVYEGWDERLARPVAVKLLRADLACHADLRRRFEFEAKAAARLSHPNVVAVYDAGEDEGRSYIVMERLRGESLADVIRRGPMDQAWLRRIADEVLAALGAAHAARIVHRDVKPANILLASDGKAKVADFGIASVTEWRGSGEADDSPTACHTGAGLVIGTVAYMAPERAMGQPATPLSDLYSLGVVLYEALTGVKPFCGGTPIEIADAALERRARNPLALRPDADPQLVAVIGRAMHPDPARRYPTDAAMAADLRRPTPEPTAIFAVGAAAVPAEESFSGAPTELDGPVATAASDEFGEPFGEPFEAVAAAPGVVASRAPTALTRAARDRRVRTALVAVAFVASAVVALLVVRPGSSSLASTTTTTVPKPAAAATTTTTLAPSDPTAVALDAIAQQVAGTGSADAAKLASGLQAVAAIADPAARGTAATNLLAQSRQWYQQGGLTYGSYVTAASVLRQAGAVGPPVAAPLTTPKPARHHKGGAG